MTTFQAPSSPSPRRNVSLFQNSLEAMSQANVNGSDLFATTQLSHSAKRNKQAQTSCQLLFFSYRTLRRLPSWACW